MKLSEVEILKLLPLFMRDDETVQALAKAADKIINVPGSKYKQMRVWDQIDNMDHKELDELAWEFNIDWYSSSLDLAAKRRIIKISDQVHKKRGTKWAVEQLITAYFGPGYVWEWFEYEGPPFEFRVLTTNKNVDEAMYQEFIKLAQTSKNVRSFLEGIYYYAEYGGSVTLSSEVQSTKFDFVKCGTRYKSAYIGAFIDKTVNAQNLIEPQTFNITEAGTSKTGLYPTVKMIGKIITTAAATASASRTFQTFNFIKCGTQKTMQ